MPYIKQIPSAICFATLEKRQQNVSLGRSITAFNIRLKFDKMEVVPLTSNGDSYTAYIKSITKEL